MFGPRCNSNCPNPCTTLCKTRGCPWFEDGCPEGAEGFVKTLDVPLYGDAFKELVERLREEMGQL